MTHDLTTAELLGITPGSLVWIVGDSVEETALLDPLPEGVETYEDEVVEQPDDRWFDDTWTGAENQLEPTEPVKPSGIDTAVIAVSNSQEFHMRLDDVLPRLGSVGSVWVLFPTGSLPLPILSTGVSEYGWGTAEPTLLDDTWSAVRLWQS
ncbi:hypothetical protein GL325_06545 [Aeromicrobium sp. 636]|uniref:DUF3052 domain-containing protein n=1 Tax=Aeromicrobium senzhongii TaxID=2663859 RepID=A0A8I0EV80_9ACTN|nr:MULTISPECIES: hypothetical protein [Aeromicrobium]MBC9225971.1 hypothetical protein [Aeromicrobium senzhongii]MCQ3998078.1 hypothetical protein [Aeromicrobium sp. 636]MTB87981.1 hypothetical protein [Aeromicrobium senzhongii]QNL95007.1 hypothetical protein H9L21_03400 [Aeromicrobium senzhongii]